MDDLTEQASPHYINSTLRERIVEHVFVGEALRRLWQMGVTDVEVLRSEFDAGGYDLVMSYHRVTRHIQFKTKTLGGKPGEPLPDISRNMIAKHAKGNAQGEKAERPNHRTIRISKFEKLVSLDMVLERPFGALEQDQTAPVAPDRALG